MILFITVISITFDRTFCWNQIYILGSTRQFNFVFRSVQIIQII